jgi:hypothetical protein
MINELLGGNDRRLRLAWMDTGTRLKLYHSPDQTNIASISIGQKADFRSLKAKPWIWMLCTWPQLARFVLRTEDGARARIMEP